MRRRLEFEGAVFDIDVVGGKGEMTATINGESRAVELLSKRPGELVLRIDGRVMALDFASDEDGAWISRDGRTFRFDRPRPIVRRHREAAGSGDEILRSPTPALVAVVEVAEGDEVEGGRTLVVLEAMKMETRIQAPPGAWRVARLSVRVGQQVGRDEELARLVKRLSGTGADTGAE